MTKSSVEERSLLEQARAKIDGRSELEEMLGQIREQQRASITPMAHEVARSLAAEVLDEILITGALPEDLMRRVTETDSAIRATELFSNVLAVLRGLLEAKLGGTDRIVGPALGFLADELRALVLEVREVDKALGRVRSAAAAVDAGDDAVRAWRQLELLAARYHELRMAQHAVMVQALDQLPAVALLRSSAMFEDVLDHDPELSQRFRGGPVPAHRWPAPIDRRGTTKGIDIIVMPSTDPAEYVRWVARSTKPWVPTLAQAEAKAAELEQLIGDAVKARAIAAGAHAADFDYSTSEAYVDPPREQPAGYMGREDVIEQ